MKTAFVPLLILSGTLAASASSFNLSIGQSVTNGVPGPGAGAIETAGDVDTYTLVVTNRQPVYFDTQLRVQNLYWQLIDPGGTPVFTSHFWDAEPGRFFLSTTGAYTIRVYGPGNATGPYAFQLWAPVTNNFAIAVGDTVSTNAPGGGSGRLDVPGDQDRFTFTATNGQRIYFDTQVRVRLLYWQLLDPDGAELFNNHFWDGEPGAVALPKTGLYTLRVYGSADTTGVYGFQLWQIPPVSEYNTGVGDFVTNGVPRHRRGQHRDAGRK